MKRLIKRGDIYNVELGSGIGSEQNGYRPGVIIQNNLGNRNSPTIIIAPVSSAVKKTTLPTHVLLPPRYGLSESSIILLEQIRTIDKQRLDNYLGHLDAQHILFLNQALQISVGLFDGPTPKQKAPPAKMVMTLCGRCLNSYWQTNAYHIRRADPAQTVKDACMFCGIRMGYDYQLTPKRHNT